MKTVRTIRIQLSCNSSLSHIRDQLADLPGEMALIDVEDDGSANPALREISLIFRDRATDDKTDNPKITGGTTHNFERNSDETYDAGERTFGFKA